MDGGPKESTPQPSPEKRSLIKLPEIKSRITRARESVPTGKINEIRDKLSAAAQDPKVRRMVSQSATEIAGSSEKLGGLVMKSRQSRLQAEQESPGERGLVYHIAKTAMEMIPGGIGPYGIGDAITLIESIIGKEIGGRKLDWVDRGISVVAAAIPVVPATPFREAVRNYRKHFEDSVAHHIQNRDQNPPIDMK